MFGKMVWQGIAQQKRQHNKYVVWSRMERV